MRALDFGRRETHAVAFLEDLIFRGRQAVDADQVILRAAAGHHLGEQLLHRGARLDLHVVGITRPPIVDRQDLHTQNSL